MSVSDDGRMVVLQQYTETGSSVFDVVDRRAGTRREFLRTSPDGDGARLHVDPAGQRVLGLRYPLLGPGESPWFLYDVRTRILDETIAGVSSDDTVLAVRDDLRGAVVQNWTAPDQPFRLIDPLTGIDEPLGLGVSDAWRNADFSPDLALALQYSSTRGFVRSVRVVSTATGEVVRDLGRVRSESEWAVDSSFVDDATVLINDAVPDGSPADGVADDGAFVVDLLGGEITRIDPGVAGASTRSATQDGARSVYSVIRSPSSWLRVDGAAQHLGATFDVVASLDHSVIVWIDEGRASLRCF